MFWNRESKQIQPANEQVVTVQVEQPRGTEIEGLKICGALSLLIEDADNVATGTHAAFYITGNQHKTNIFRASSVEGTHGEQITLEWERGEKPRLKYLVEPLVKKQRRYVVRWT